MKRKWPIALISTGLIVCVLTLISVPVLNLTVHTPGRAVLTYFKALENHDTDRALTMLDIPHSTNLEGVTDDILSGAASVPRQAEVVDSTQVNDNEYDVKVSYVQGSDTRETTFRVKRNARTFGTVQKWYIKVDQWPVITIDTGGAPTAQLNGVSVPAGETPVLFPVTYTVDFNSTYLRSNLQTVDVAEPATTSDVNLTGKPTEELTKKVTEILKEQIDQCVKEKTLMPTGCGFGKETTNQILGDVKWKVKSYPHVTLENGASGIEMAPANVELTVSGKQRDAVTAFESTFTDTVTARMRAQVRIEGNNVTVVQEEAE